jgi:hypothetical protein
MFSRNGESRDAFGLIGAEFQGADVRGTALGTRAIEEVQRVAGYVGAGVRCWAAGFHQNKIRCSGSCDVGKAEINIVGILRTRVAGNDIGWSLAISRDPN